MGSSKKCLTGDDVPEHKEQYAGEFSSWLHHTRRVLKLATVGADVVCGECTGCCRSSMFIHIRPEETRALKRIPKALQFPAPGLPKGNMLMGYNKKGECPMLAEGKCSIYEDRPQTCRDYDCRVFAATGIEVDGSTQKAIAEQVKRWRFEFPSEQDRKEHSALQAAAKFLSEHRDAFPEGARPSNPAQLAVLAIRVYHVLSKLMEEAAHTGESPSDSDIAKAVLSAMEEQKSGPRRVRSRS
jgi:uncharacterized protein